MENNNSNNNLDDAIRAMKATEPSAEQSKLATARVFSALNHEQPVRVPERFESDRDFRLALKPYLRNELGEAQRMLVEDRLASDPEYRRAMNELRGNVREFAPPPARRSATRSFAPWAIAAGVLIAVGYLSMDTMDRLMAPAGARAEIASVTGEIFKVSAAGLQPLKPGTALAENEAVRTAKGSSAVVRLPDGSLIEMNERSELSISSAYSGSTVRLDRGNIVIQAAKQKRGALKVATRESTVSVKGTIFSVAAGLRGTQVAVVEGNVIVEQSGKRESLLPGEVTASDAALRRTNVSDQVAWSKDSVRYMTMMGELSKISRQIQALPMPSLRTESKLMKLLPADTVVYVAIPNLSGTVADAAKIFEDRLRQSPALQQWWDTKQVAEIRAMAEKLRSAGSQLGEEIVIGAVADGKKSLGVPFLLAEVKGSAGKAMLEGRVKEFAGDAKLGDNLSISDRYLMAAGSSASLRRLQSAVAAEGGFDATPLAATVKKSYAKGAGWILAVDMEQMFAQSVEKMRSHDKSAMDFTGINKMRHLMVERRDSAGRSDTRASVNFGGVRTGMASWLAAPAPMPSLEYVSPDAAFAMSAVTKNAKLMAEEFFGAVGAGQSSIEKEIGIDIVNDLAGTLGGEVTVAIDGALIPIPTWLMAVEVYDVSRLTATLRKTVETVNVKMAASGNASVNLSEETLQGRTWYRIKSAQLPVEMNFTYANGYMLAAGSRDTITKALRNRDSGLTLTRSQTFRDLLPQDTQVNASGILFFNVGSGLKAIAEQLKNGLDLPDEQKQAIDQVSGNTGPVLICAYAGADSLTVASTSGFFGFGLDTFLAAGRGMPILPQILSGAAGRLPKPQRIQ